MKVLKHPSAFRPSPFALGQAELALADTPSALERAYVESSLPRQGIPLGQAVRTPHLKICLTRMAAAIAARDAGQQQSTADERR
jgi:hypothetical protein